MSFPWTPEGFAQITDHLVQRSHDISGDTQADPDIFQEDIDLICLAIEMNFYVVLNFDSSPHLSEQRMTFFISSLDYLEDFLTNPVRLWVLSKHIEVAAAVRKMKKMSHAETVDKLITQVLKLFEDSDEILRVFILQLHRIMSNVTLQLSFNCGVCHERYKPIVFDIQDDITRFRFVECLLNVLIRSLDFASLDEDIADYFMMVCYKVMAHMGCTPYARMKSASIMLTLLKAKKCRGPTAVHVIDMILGTEMTAIEGGEELLDQRRELLKCLDIMTPALRVTEEEAWLSDIPDEAYLNWARRAVDLIFAQRGFTTHVDNFASSCIYRLSRIEDVDNKTFKAYEILATRLNEFVKRVFNTAVKNRQQIIRDAIGFLIYVDNRSGESSYRSTILTLLDPVTEEQISETLIEHLNDLSVIIASLSDSRSPSAPQIIETLFPSRDRIFWLLECSCRLVDGWRVLTPLMSIVAGATICGDVDKDVIMSFLSVPWLMEDNRIEWTQFDRSNTALREVKQLVAGRRLGNIFNAKMVSLQAIAKFRFHDEWRWAICRAALMTPNMFSEALACLPLLVRSLHVNDEKTPNRRLMIRWAPKILSEMVTYLLNRIREQDSGSDVEEEENAHKAIDECLESLAEVFGYKDSRSLLSKVHKQLCACLVVSSLEYHDEARITLDRIAMILYSTLPRLVERSFPKILDVILHSAPYDYDKIARTWRSVDMFLKEITDLEMKDLIKQRLTPAIDQMVYGLSLCEEFCRQELHKMSMMQGYKMREYSLSTHLRDTYLGMLLKFRHVLVGDEYFATRPVLLSSLSALMKGLERSFMDKIAPRMVTVLRAATEFGEISVPAWNTFVRCLSPSALVKMLPHIFVSAAPVLQYASAKDMMEFVRRSLQTNALSQEENERIERLSAVLYDNDMIKIGDYLPLSAGLLPTAKLISCCMQVLREETAEVAEIALWKLRSLLPSFAPEDTVATELVHLLLEVMKTNPNPRVHGLVCQCLGIIGALDPARIVQHSTSVERRGDDYVDFETQKIEFFAKLLTNCAKLHMECVSIRSVDYIAFGIQLLLQKLSQMSTVDLKAIEAQMKEEHKEQIASFKTSRFRMTGELASPVSERPVISVKLIRKYTDWIAQWYAICANYVQAAEPREVYDVLKCIVSTGAADVNFGLFAICSVMTQLLIEGDEGVLKECVEEMTAVLQKAHEGEGWLKQTAHVVFSVIDTAEKYLSFRLAQPKPSGRRAGADEVCKRVEDFIQAIMAAKVGEDPLAVVVAQSCHCPARALRWLEKYCIECDSQGVYKCSRNQFFLLEKIYADLDNADGVQGAFECIEATSCTSAEESIVFFEASGNYNEALSFYKSGTLTVPLMRSLLRLNKPEIAWNASAALSQQDDVSSLQSYQIEAAWRLSKWSDVDSLVTQVEKKPDANWTWGSSVASIFSAIRSCDSKRLETRVDRARDRLVSSMTTMTMEDSDAYLQCYKYISQLSILTEIEQGVSSLDLLQPVKDKILQERDLAHVLTGWKNRSEAAMNAVWIQEPMFAVRRSLVEHSNAAPAVKSSAVCNLLLQSSRAARQAGHHQVAWTFLVQAKDKGVCEMDVVQEESRYLFEKGETSRAVTLLENTTCRLFPAEAKAFKECMVSSKSKFDEIINECGTTDTNLATFVKAKVLLCEYIQRAGESSADDLYKAYVFLNKFGDKTEDLCYRVAVFQDSYVYSTEGALDDVLVSEVLKAYSMVLKRGRSHLFHAMPRILTIWLDTAQEIVPVKNQKSGKTMQSYRDASVFNKIISELFTRTNHFMFYTAFAQLISRITHPNESVFEVLKEILSTLIAEYPHQCLWKSISVYRSSDRTSKGRYERCSKIYELAMRKGQNVQLLISHYKYIAKEFMKVCDETRFAKGETKGSIKSKFPQITRFFEDGTMHDARSNQPRGKPMLLLPLSEFLEREIEPPVHSLTQVPNDYHMSVDPEEFPLIYIDSIIDEFEVISSIARPKKCVLRGSNGELYPILFKPSDELRKDSRVMDIARMVNSLLMQNADARRKNLSIRTYTVIPLQEKGGLIEWVPNLKPLRRAILPLLAKKFENKGQRHNEGTVQQLLNAELSQEDRLKGLLQLYERYPVVMSEWLRANFSDPARWYSARMAFTTTTAVMSMVGFILGLGDRHAENILLDENSGQIIHVDYNMLFYKAEELRVPEVVPFRLTRNIIDGFGPTGVEGVYRKACETTMTILREKKDMLITVLQAFCHDPLLEWGIERSQQHRQSLTKGSAVNQVKPADEVVFMVEERLIGKIVSPKVFKSRLTNVPMTIQGQVAKLIDIAKDERKLALMYVGWAPHF